MFIFLYVSHWCTSHLCCLVGRDMCVPFFTFLCLSPAYQPFVRSCKERHVCLLFSHFCTSLTGVPAFCGVLYREICLSLILTFLYVSHLRTSLLCGLVGRDMCVPSFTLSVSPVYQSLLFLCRKGDLHYDEKQWNISSIDD